MEAAARGCTGRTHASGSATLVQEKTCICRLSEVTDWEVGGRTSERDVARILETELETGPHKVVAMVRRGGKGVAFSCALNRCEAYRELPAMDDERCRTCIWGEVHASPYALLQGAFAAELVDEMELAIARREEEEQKLRVAEAKRMVRCGMQAATPPLNLV